MRSPSARDTLALVVNPYAPPAPAPAVMAQAPLPQGMRRFRLERRRYLSLVRRIVLVRQGAVLLVLALFVVYLELLDLPFFLPPWVFLVFWAVLVGVTWLRQRAMAEKQLAMFEVIASARVVRRVMPLLPIAEMLRPEVTRIVETRRALSLVSTSPRRTLSITRAVEGYDELRAELATWGTIETLRGWSAFAFAWGQLRHMRPRDVIAGTALATDATLLDELTTVRALSADAGHGYGPVMNVRRRLVFVALLWLLLIGMWLAIWQLFSEPEPSPRARPVPALSV